MMVQPTGNSGFLDCSTSPTSTQQKTLAQVSHINSFLNSAKFTTRRRLSHLVRVNHSPLNPPCRVDDGTANREFWVFRLFHQPHSSSYHCEGRGHPGGVRPHIRVYAEEQRSELDITILQCWKLFFHEVEIFRLRMTNKMVFQNKPSTKNHCAYLHTEWRVNTM